MVHSRSVFFWDNLPMVEYLQFPWRFLTLVIFSISIIGGGIIFLLKNKKAQIICSALLMAATVGLNISFFRVEKTFPMTDDNKLFSAKGWNKLQTDAIFDYLPKTAKAPPAGKAPDKPEIIEGKAIINEVKRGTNWYQFSIDVQEKAIVQIPQYDFPKWKVTVDKKIVSYANDNFLGLVTIQIPEGKHFVKMNLTDTPIRVTGNLISLFSWIIFTSSVLKLGKWVRKRD